ncbi:CHAT domain-containing protein [Streptomyces xantholiticus]|uniref:CHAT domain-containing protein n=1 Tax=Streptomyces xantholiticus TaxID=68285 RepID=UPI001E4268E7|nr:CHAT domain-containing protein [Streptomyces xantholiticus]
MASPDEERAWAFDAPEAVLAGRTHYNVAHRFFGIEDRLTPEQIAADKELLEVVYLVAGYHLARCQHLPEEHAAWDHHTTVFLFALVHAVRPGAVPQPLRESFAAHPPQVVAAHEIVHAVGNALFMPSVPARFKEGVTLAAALIGKAREGARGTKSEPPITFNLGTAMVNLADFGIHPEEAWPAGLYLMREAAAALPPGDPAREEMLAQLLRTQAKAPPVVPPEGGVAAEMSHYMRGGDLDRLDTSLKRLRATIEAPGTDEPERSHRRLELAQLLRMRFEIRGELADLDTSITELGALLADGRLNKDERASAYSFLGLAHLDRYTALGQLGDLDAATEAVRRSHEPELAASPRHTQRLTNLAAVLTARFDTHQDRADLDEAVDHLTYAVAATPPWQHDRPVMMIKLALALWLRGRHTQGDADIEAAEAILRQVAGDPGELGPSQQLARMHLGHLLMTRGRDRGDISDVVEAVEHHRITALSPTQDIRTRLHCAALWGATSMRLGAVDEACTAFRCALTELLPKLTARALTRKSQEVRLSELPALANVAAAVEIAAGRPREALIRLEQGRGVLLAQALRLRGRHEELAASSPALADRFEQVCAELVAAERSPEKREESAAAFDELVDRIRALPGFEQFHRPPDWDQLSRAAAHGPIAVINVYGPACHVLLLHQPPGRDRGEIDVLPLDGVTEEEIGRRADAFRTAAAMLAGGVLGSERRRQNLVLKDTLRWLGRCIVRPVLTRLGIDRPRQNKPQPRLWWCPTGVLALLPLHAALLDEADVYTHDRVVSSYIPTLGSLLYARHRPAPAPGDTSLIAVAVDAGDAYPRLTALDDELTATQQLSARRNELRDGQATPQAVLAALRSHTHAHLACHGVHDRRDPSRSRLLLHAGDLTLSELAAERLTEAEFAYLSACHSAAPGQELVDEVISVASAFQLCGYRQVIGSLWTVEDAMAPQLAHGVYRALAAPDSPGAAYALHHAIGTLRQHTRYGDPLFWGSIIHSGP